LSDSSVQCVRYTNSPKLVSLGTGNQFSFISNNNNDDNANIYKSRKRRISELENINVGDLHKRLELIEINKSNLNKKFKYNNISGFSIANKSQNYLSSKI
jgi:hypothetical protein